jgi:AraC-like DNA-binding protein
VTVFFQPYPLPAGREAHAWHYQPAFRRPRHFHEEPEFNLVTRGDGILEIGDRSLAVRAGHLVWFPPGIEHYLAAASADFEMLSAAFSPAIVHAFEREHSLGANFARPWQVLEESQYRPQAEVLEQIRSMSDHRAAERRQLDVLRHFLLVGEPRVASLSYRAASYLLTNPSASRDDLVRALHSNRGDLSRTFHRDHGVTLVQYRNIVRTLGFLRLSDKGSANLIHAAMNAGFGSYSQCHRVFSSLFGLSPREFFGTLWPYPRELMDLYEPLKPFAS